MAFTWWDLGKSILGIAVGGILEGVGIGASMLVKMPRGTSHGLRAIWKTKELGPILKTTVTPFALVGGIVSPAIGLLGGMIQGMVRGFLISVDSGVTSVPSTIMGGIRQFHTVAAEEAISTMAEWAARPPQKYFEIEIIEALVGLLCGLFGAVVTGIGVTLTTLFHLPGAYLAVTHNLWSDLSGGMFPLILGAQVLLTGLIVVAPALAVIVATLGGLGVGAARGYTHGFSAAFRCFGDIRKYNEFLVETIY